MPTYIRFDRDHDLEVAEEPEAVAEAIEAVGDSPIPLIRLTRNNGKQVLVNAGSIRTVTSSSRGERRA
jgi:hypothetical protein